MALEIRSNKSFAEYFASEPPVRREEKLPPMIPPARNSRYREWANRGRVAVRTERL